MTYRYMRGMVLFDLPVTTSENIRQYTKVRKFLLKSGFIMMQESVYSKLALNPTVANSIMESVRAKSPPDGLVQMLMVTEKQYSRMELVVGEYHSSIIDDEERLVII